MEFGGGRRKEPGGGVGSGRVIFMATAPDVQ